MRVLVTGGAGFLGRALVRRRPAQHQLAVTWRTSRPPEGVAAHRVDLADEDALIAAIAESEPDVVVHTAYGRADGARDIRLATRNVAAACRDLGAELIHLSSDVVFAGEAAPYLEDDRPDPVFDYGRDKAAAEAVVTELVPSAAIVRTSLLTSVEPLDPRSAWVRDALLDAAPIESGRGTVPDVGAGATAAGTTAAGTTAAGTTPAGPTPAGPTLYVDEIRQPILVDDLADQLWELVTLPVGGRQGVWHLTGPEALSRYALGLLIAAHERLNAAAIIAASSPQDPTQRRPRDLRLVTWRADAALATRPRPISCAFGSL